MFYSHTFLARKSPLGPVWIAAHLQHKLRKNHVTVTDISSTVDFIMFPEVPIALRLSAHLLLGVVRIYSKKVDYLHHDCTEVWTRIRTAFASVNDVNLPEDATSAPFHSITLPDTFELDALDLQDDLYHEGTLDNHLKSQEDITMADQIPGVGDPYVVFFINEDITMVTSSSRQIVDAGVRPTEEDVPSVQEDIGVGVSDHGASNPSKEFDQKLLEDHLSEGLPEIEFMRDAVHDFRLNNLPDWIESGNQITEEHGPVEQTVNDKENLAPIMEDISESGGQSMLFQLHPDLPSNFGSAQSLENFNSHVSLGHISPELAIRPTPPEEKKKPKPRKRKQMFDTTVVLSNRLIKEGLNNPSALVSKRRKLPCSALDFWKFKNRSRKEQNFFESTISGLHGDLQDLLKKEFISSKVCKSSVEATSPEGRHPRPPTPLPDIDREIEHLRFAEHHDHGSSLPELRLSPFRNYEFTPPSDGNLGPVPETGSILGTEVLPTLVPSASVASLRSDLETPITDIEEHLVMEETGLSAVQEFSNMNEGDLCFLDADNTPIGREENDLHTLSVRTRAVAQYLKEQSPATEIPKDKTGKLSLNKILEGKTRKRCAQMFFETLVLKSYDLIDVEQEDAYGDITLLLTPLSNAKF